GEAGRGIEFAIVVVCDQACPNHYTLTRTYHATDSCGNVGACTQTINVDDNTPPVASCPGSQTVECAADAPPASDLAGFAAQGGDASDNCAGALSAQFVNDAITNQTCRDRYTITRTYRVGDAC